MIAWNCGPDNWPPSSKKGSKEGDSDVRLPPWRWTESASTPVHGRSGSYRFISSALPCANSFRHGSACFQHSRSSCNYRWAYGSTGVAHWHLVLCKDLNTKRFLCIARKSHTASSGVIQTSSSSCHSVSISFVRISRVPGLVVIPGASIAFTLVPTRTRAPP